MSTYCLGTSYTSTIGLNLQYALMQRCLEGRLLEPEIPFKAPHLTIADMPCGTCMWLIDMAKEVDSTTKLEGFDLTIGQGAPAPYLPSNISLQKLNMLEAPPTHLLSRFDVIHVRFVVCFVDDDAISKLTRNLSLMLKPGGHLQWIDALIADHRYESAIPGYQPTAMLHALDKSYEIAEWQCPQWVREPEVYLTQAGFEIVAKRHPESPPYLGRAFAELDLLAMTPISATAAGKRGEAVAGAESEDLAQLVKEAAEEIVEKQIGCFPAGFLIIAKKAS